MALKQLIITIIKLGLFALLIFVLDVLCRLIIVVLTNRPEIWEFLFRYKLPYENGRYFDENSVVVYEEQAKEVYGFLAFLFVIVMIVLTRWTFK